VKGHPALPGIKQAMDQALSSSHTLAQLQVKCPTSLDTIYFYANLLTTSRRRAEVASTYTY
jgi:hypothetical protein